MTGGTSLVDQYVFVATDADLSATTPTDIITNFVTTSDKLVLGAAGTLAVSAVPEVTAVTFAALTTTQTAIVNGITITAHAGLPAADVASIYAGETDVIAGTNTAGYAAGPLSATSAVAFTYNAAGTQADLVSTGTAGKVTASYVQGVTAVAETQTVTITGTEDTDGTVLFLGVATASVTKDTTVALAGDGSTDTAATAAANSAADIDAVGAAIVAAKVAIMGGTDGLAAGLTNISYNSSTNALTLTYTAGVSGTGTGNVGAITSSATDNGMSFSAGTEVIQGVAGVVEVATLTFSALASGETAIVNGVTVTAPAGGLTAIGVADLFASRASGAATVDVLTGTDTLPQTGVASGAVVTLTQTTAGTQTDLTAAGTGTAATINVTTQGAAAVVGNYAENETAVADIATLLTAADTALNGTVDFYFGVVGSDGYLVQDDNGTGHTNFIQLTGVTAFAPGDVAQTAV